MVPLGAGASAAGATPAKGELEYLAGSAANLALQPALQKYTGLPSCWRTCGDWAVTFMPQTGSLTCTDDSIADAAAFGEQQLATCADVGSAVALSLAHPHLPLAAAAFTAAASEE